MHGVVELELILCWDTPDVEGVILWRMTNDADVDRAVPFCSWNQWLTLLQGFHTETVLHPKPARPFYLLQYLQNGPASVHGPATRLHRQHPQLSTPTSDLLGSVRRALQESPCPSSSCVPISLQGPTPSPPLSPLPVSLPGHITLPPSPQREPKSQPCARPSARTLFLSPFSGPPAPHRPSRPRPHLLSDHGDAHRHLVPASSPPASRGGEAVT